MSLPLGCKFHEGRDGAAFLLTPAQCLSHGIQLYLCAGRGQREDVLREQVAS